MPGKRPPPRVLLANEAGGGRGHVAKLAAVARALGPGLPKVAALGRGRFAGELAPWCEQVTAAPPLRPEAAEGAAPAAGNATWGDYLAAIGLAREDVVRRGLAFWRQLIVAENISILVADYAPLAMRAAQGLKAEGWEIAIVSIGTGYGVPPAHLDRYPVLMEDHARVVHPEDEVLALVNRVAGAFGFDPLPRLPAIGAADLALPCSFAFLDPYADTRAPGELCPPSAGPVPLAGGGGELFAYFAGGEAAAGAFVRALEVLPMPRRAYLPGVGGAMLERLAAAGVAVETAPLAAAEIAARTRLLLCAGQHGTLCLAALAGLPAVVWPGHLEQLFHARRAAARGLVRLVPGLAVGTGAAVGGGWAGGADVAGAIAGAVRAAWEDRGLVRAARDLAAELRPDHPADPLSELARRLAPVVARARAFGAG